MNYATQGAAALESSDYLTAVSAYTKALIEHPASPDYFIQRSTAFTRLKPARYDLALQDAEYAVLLGQKRQKRENIQAAQQRRVVALHGLGQYQNAKFILQTMMRWRPKNNKKDKMQGDIWLAKAEQKIKTSEQQQNAVATVKEFPEVLLPDEKTMVAWLQLQLNADGTFNFGEKTTTENPIPIAEKAPSKVENGSSLITGAAPKSQPALVLSKIRDEWYQNSQTVTVTLYAKGVSKNAANIDIQDDSVYVEFPHPSNPSSTFTFSLDPLFALIDPTTSKSSVMSTKVEINLRKKIEGQKWPSLEGTAPLKSAENGTDPKAKAAIISTIAKSSNTQPATTIAPSYPTSSRNGPKNWDKVATDLTTKPKKKKEKTDKNDSEPSDDDDGIDSDYDNGDPVDGFFKKLYAGADDDTRRAMMKSFQESGGTALSTNWNEVGKGRVDPVKSKDDD